MESMKRAPRDPEQIGRLRLVFETQIGCNWIRYRRTQITEVPMPGEDGYSFNAHINALRTAIKIEGESRMYEATKYRYGEDNLEEMYAATLRRICAMDPEIAEAYRPTQRRRPRRRAGAGPELVYSCEWPDASREITP